LDFFSIVVRVGLSSFCHLAQAITIGLFQPLVKFIVRQFPY
jgi:hypothetical protein